MTNLLPAMSMDDDDDDDPPSLDNGIIHARKASPRVEEAVLSKEYDENTAIKVQQQRQMSKTKSEPATIRKAASPLAAENRHTTSPKSEKRFSVAEVPRWRFVNKAKKTAGYSSSAAGQVVKGKHIISKHVLCSVIHDDATLFQMVMMMPTHLL